MTNQLMKANGEIKNIIPNDNKHFSLEELQDYVNGHIEIVKLNGLAGMSGYILVINEEGKLNNLQFNEAATFVFHNGIIEDDFIVGDALFIHENYLE